MSDIVVISGTIEKYIHHNYSTGSSMFLIQSSEEINYRMRTGCIKCSGFIPDYRIGQPVILTGNFQNNIFYVNNCKTISNNYENAISMLANNLVKGIGIQTATNIVKLTGKDIYSFINRNDAKQLLMTVPMITEEKASELIRKIRMISNEKDVYEYISFYGGTYSQAQKISKIYGMNPLKKIKENPYGKILSVCGFSIEKCDEMAHNNGILEDSPMRLKALVHLALIRYKQNGNTYASFDVIEKLVNRMIKNSIYNQYIKKTILVAFVPSNIIIEEKDNNLRIYLKNMYQAEESIKNNIMRLKRSSIPMSVTDELIKRYEDNQNISLANKQKEAVKLINNGGVNIITGGPGTGKTTVIKCIMNMYQHFSSKCIVLCAPTGRAAGRMMEATGQHATTIHRTLEFEPYGDTFQCKNHKNPIDAGLIIVDEMSMVDTELMSLLLDAVQNGSSLILVGDTRQLESVGAGNILHDLINSNIIPTIELNVFFRQEEKSSILVNGEKIRNFTEDLKEDRFFEIHRVKTQDELYNEALSCAKEYYSTEELFDFQVLSSTRVNLCGTEVLNKEIQKYINTNSSSTICQKNEFHIGDKIMMIRNNYELEYFNGDLGTVNDIRMDEMDVLINDIIITIPELLYEDIELAYATTIHKSQGSEYKIVMIVLARTPNIMLTNNLLNTAVSRAKEKVIIITEEDALEVAIHTKREDARLTGLTDKLKNTETHILL